MFVKFAILLLVFNTTGSNCANILYAAALPSPSHYIFHKTLALALVDKGHNVTILTHETDQNKLPKNLTVVSMTNVLKELQDSFDMNDFINSGILKQITAVGEVMLIIAENDCKSKGFQTIWNYPKDFKFDLIIYDSTMGRFMYSFTERFHNPPSIALTPFLLPPALTVSFGGYPISAYEPYSNTGYTDKMNLFQRTWNAICTYFDIFYTLYVFQPQEDALVAKKFPNLKSTLDELEDRISLVLCNTDAVMDHPKILPPNIIPIGGMHARPSKSLPKDLQAIMDNAKSGVILFSLGTNIKSDELPPSVIKAFLNVFSKLPQTVIWKFESDLTDLPKNVIFKKWLPQNDVMGHPNIKLFINHGGALSSQEALYHGIPIISIPFVLDQVVNAKKAVSKKTGLMLDKENLNEETIGEALHEILNTETYRKNVKILSAKYRDQPLSALDRAIFWVEYLMRHGNADHLSAPTRRFPFYKTFHLDILLVLLILFSGFILMIKFCFKIVFNRKTTKIKKN